MTPSSKCVSLETAKRLMAAGFPQDTERWWFTTNGKDWELGGAFSSRADGNISAPDAQEIGEQLGTQQHTWKHPKGYVVEHFLAEGQQFNDENEAEARAACWLHLKENNLI